MLVDLARVAADVPRLGRACLRVCVRLCQQDRTRSSCLASLLLRISLIFPSPPAVCVCVCEEGCTGHERCYRGGKRCERTLGEAKGSARHNGIGSKRTAGPLHQDTDTKRQQSFFCPDSESGISIQEGECSYLLAIDAVAKRRHGRLTYNPQLLAPRSSAPTFHHPAVASHHRCPRQRTNQRADTRNNKNKDNKRQGQGERQLIYVMLAVEGG